MFDSPKSNAAVVTLYTTPGCADCAAVKRYLEHKGIMFQEKDVSTNPAWLDEVKKVSGVRIAPVTVVGGVAFYGSFDDQKPWLEQAFASRKES